MSTKKLVLAISCAAFSTGSFAQSSVTLYGLLDEGININTNAAGQHQYYMASGVLSGSRWGLKGAEELGGGFSAIFTLENGFNVESGRLAQGGLLFGRQAYVGISSKQYGSVTMGRQYDSVVDYLGPFEAGDQWGGYISAHPADIDNFNNAYRTNNAIKYTSANYGGLVFGGLYSLGGFAGQPTRAQVFSLGGSYTSGPLALAIAYLNARNPNAGLFATASQTPLTPATANVTSPVISGYTSARTYQVIGAAGAYTIGAATIGATYSNVAFRGLGDTRDSGPNPNRYSGTATFNNAELNLKYQFTPALLGGIAFDYTKSNGPDGSNGGAKYLQYAAGIDYFLSKRTDLYGIAVWQKASGTDSRNLPAVAAINVLTASSNNHQAAFRLGIRHKF